MKLRAAGLLCSGLMLIQPELNGGQPAVSSQVREAVLRAEQLELAGSFEKAAGILKETAERSNLSEAERRLAGFELDRLQRIRRDYPLTRDALFAELKKAVKDLDKSEFDRWVDEGRFDCRTIDGKVWFMSSSVSNLFFRYQELEPRRLPPKDTADLERRRWETISSIKTAARASGQPYVLPKRLEATMQVTLRPGVTRDGDVVRAWIPIPRDYPFQTGFDLIDSAPAVKQLAAPESPVRSAYFEDVAKGDQPARFSITYRFTKHGVWFDLDPARASRPEITPDLRPFIQEATHVKFTPELRQLAQAIAGNETNALLRAKRYYDWIGQNIKYSYAIEYSTIRNISEYCRSKGYGDCGQEALLFITLCRMDNIPARWQSGWNLYPGAQTIHDWSEIYIAPYGWVPVDPYMSIYATRYVKHLSAEQKRELRDFYFGGLDHYRMAANSDHCQELTPAKTGFRSDTVDFQRGELDVNGKNVYYDGFSYSLNLKEIEP